MEMKMTPAKTTAFFFDAITYTGADIQQVVREQITIGEYGLADALRTAVMYLPPAMSANEFVAGACACGVNSGTARNRYHEVRRWQCEMGEV